MRVCSALVALATAFLLASCASNVEIAAHLRPLPQETMMLLGRKGMDVQAPIFVRVFKEESELEIWKLAGIDIGRQKGPWYRDTGQGMGPALNTAAAMNAYILADRGTWLAFRNRGELAVAVEGDKRLYNQYGVMLVNPAKHPNVKQAMGQAFIDWLISPEGQKAIADYKIGGEQLFFPSAGS